MSSKFDDNYYFDESMPLDEKPEVWSDEQSSKSKKKDSQSVSMAEILTSPEVLQFGKDLLLIGKHEGSKLRTHASNHFVSAKANYAPTKAFLKQRSAEIAQLSTSFIKSFVDKVKNPINADIDWNELDKPVLARKLGDAEFKEWQHLNNIIETPATPTLIKANELKFNGM